jgi:uncharacterized membrane protein YhaH (DUF805 family)
MDWIYLFTSFSGRISRQPFWIGCGILAAVIFASELLVYAVEGESLSSIKDLELGGGDRSSNLVDLVFTYPQFALAVKRANDRDLSPSVVGLFFAINVALDLFTLWNGAIDMDNSLNQIIVVPFALFLVILIVELGFRRGTDGPNRFGPDPRARKA